MWSHRRGHIMTHPTLHPLASSLSHMHKGRESRAGHTLARVF